MSEEVSDNNALDRTSFDRGRLACGDAPYAPLASMVADGRLVGLAGWNWRRCSGTIGACAVGVLLSVVLFCAARCRARHSPVWKAVIRACHLIFGSVRRPPECSLLRKAGGDWSPKSLVFRAVCTSTSSTADGIAGCWLEWCSGWVVMVLWVHEKFAGFGGVPVSVEVVPLELRSGERGGLVVGWGWWWARPC